MSPNTPRDDLLARYEEAKALLQDDVRHGLPEEPSAATRERIMQAAREQASAINSIAPRADSMPANDQKGPKSSLETQIQATAAANDSFWNIKAVASLAIMGLSALLWWQFEQGTPGEQEAAKSAQPTAAAPAAPPRPAPARDPAPAPTSVTETASAPPEKPAAATVAKPRAPVMPPAPAAKPETAAQPPSAETALSKSSAPPVITAQEAPASPTSPTAPIASTANNAQRDRIADTARAPTAEAAMPRPAPAPAPAAAAVPMMRGAPPTAQIQLQAAEPLFTAIAERNAPALRQALSQGISPNARNADGNPALTQAVMQRWAEGVRILLAAGADRNAKSNKGHTASDVALELGYADMAELLAAPR